MRRWTDQTYPYRQGIADGLTDGLASPTLDTLDGADPAAVDDADYMEGYADGYIEGQRQQGRMLRNDLANAFANAYRLPHITAWLDRLIGRVTHREARREQ